MITSRRNLLCPQPAGEPPPTRGSCFFAKFTADFIFSGNSRNFNCPVFHLKHSFSKLRGIYKCFMNALVASCLSRIPCRGATKNDFQPRNLHGWYASLLISLQGIMPARQRTCKNLCVSVSVHTSVMNVTLKVL